MQYNQGIQTSVDFTVRLIFEAKIDPQSLADTLNDLYPKLMNQYDVDLQYTETIEWFIATAQLLKGTEYPNEVHWDKADAINFVEELETYSPQYHIIKLNFVQQETRNRESLEKYVRQLTTHYARLLFVRVDLKYSNMANVDVESFECHMSKLLERISNKKSCFKYLEGYAWALEQGEINGGLHCHLLLLYDGRERHKAWRLAKQVGENWNRITEGKGCYYNPHDKDNIHYYEKRNEVGIGMIFRDEPRQIANAIRTASYLTDPRKFNQRLKAKLPRMRTFGHGTYRNTKRRGLPPRSK